MDLEVCVNDRVQVCKLYREVEAFIVEELRKWNNFEEPEKPLTITIKRIPNNDPPALGVRTGETVNTEDLFGRV